MNCRNHPQTPADPYTGVCENCTRLRRERDGVKKPFLPESTWREVDWSKPTSQIAKELGVSAPTVRAHRP